MDDPPPKQSDFFTAVSSGDLDAIQNIIAKMQSIADKIQMINCKGTYDGQSFTALNVAIRCNQPEALKEMLKGVIGKQREEIFLTSTDSMENDRSFHLAAKYSIDASLLMTMMETLSSTQIMGLMCATTKEQWTSLHVAAGNNKNDDVIRALIDWTDKDQRMTLLTKETVNKGTPFHVAAKYKNKDALKVFLETLDTEKIMTLLSMKQSQGSTPIHIVAQHSADAMKVMLETLDTEQVMTLLSMKQSQGWTPVHYAAAQHSADAMKVMLETLDKGRIMTLLCLNIEDGSTPIHVAAQHSADAIKVMLVTLDTEQVMTLLRLKQSQGWTPVHYAAAQHSADAMKVMLETLDTGRIMTLLCLKIENGSTPIHIAAQHSADAMKVMLETLDTEQTKTLLSMKADDGWTPIHVAAQRSADAMKVMLETLDKGRIMTLLCLKIENGSTPIHIAAQHSADAMKVMLETLDTEQTKTLLSMKADDGWTPIHVAAQRSADAMKVMLETLDKGRRMTLLCLKIENGSTPIHIAAQHSADAMKVMLETLDTEQTKTLLSMKADDGWTPIHVAAQRSADAMKVMLETLDTGRIMTLLCLKIENGSTPIHIAAQHSADPMKVMLETLDTEQVMTLLSMKQSQGWTPIHGAAQHSADAMKAMLGKVDREQIITFMSMRTASGSTPIHIAANFNKNMSIIRLMIENIGPHQTLAQLGATNSNGNNTLDLCNSRDLMNEVIMAFKEEDIVAKIKMLTLRYRTGTKVLHGLVTGSEFSVAYDFLSASSVHSNLNNKICLLIAAKTGNVTTDSRMVFRMRNAYLDLQIDAQFTESLFDYMATSDSKALSQLLDLLLTNSKSTNQPFSKEDHLLLWEDGSDNNFLHLAASVDHTQFICKIITTQHGNEINQALLTKNTKGQAPYYLASTQESRRLLAWSETQDGCYPLITPPRVVVFYSDENRPGSEREKDSFLSILPALSIEATVIKNPTKKEIYDRIRDHQNGDVSALIVVIMAHGNKGTVTAQDGPLPIDNILMQMNPRSLSGIPKVLILQACQGAATSGGATDNEISHSVDHLGGAAFEGVVDHSTSSLDSSPRTQPPAESKTEKTHYDLSGPDMAVVAATINKQTATRNLLIPLLAENLKSSKPEEDLPEVFRKTVKILKLHEPAQVPEFRSTMESKLCLHKVFRKDKPYKSSVEPPPGPDACEPPPGHDKQNPLLARALAWFK